MGTEGIGDPIEVSSLTLGENAVLELYMQEQSFVATTDSEGGSVRLLSLQVGIWTESYVHFILTYFRRTQAPHICLPTAMRQRGKRQTEIPLHPSYPTTSLATSFHVFPFHACWSSLVTPWSLCLAR